jgi:transcriptional regulator with XRE-family HTH domain
MTNTRDLIIQLKEVREEKGLSYNDILSLMEKNGDYLSKSTISRVFSEGSEEMSFRYEETIRPLAKVLLDIETIEDDDTLDTRAMKSLLKYKIQRIEELEKQVEKLDSDIVKIKLSNHEKMEAEREVYNRRVEFLKNQIELKDKRMDQLLEAIFIKDKLYNELLEKTLDCHCCPNMKGDTV